MEIDTREAARITFENGIIRQRVGDHSVTLNRNMGLERLAAQLRIRRLHIRFQTIRSCVTRIGNGRMGIDGVLSAGLIALAGFHRRGALALDSTAYSFGWLPDAGNVSLRRRT